MWAGLVLFGIFTPEIADAPGYGSALTHRVYDSDALTVVSVGLSLAGGSAALLGFVRFARLLKRRPKPMVHYPIH